MPPRPAPSRLRRLSRRAFLLAGAAALGLPSGWWYAERVEPYWLAVEAHTLTLPGLPAAFDGLTVVQLSDLHLGPVPTPEASDAMVAAAVRTAVALRPDLIVITGDFVRRWGWESRLTEALRPLTAPLGVLGVRGNHDWYRGAEAVAERVTAAGVHLLNNAHLRLTRGDEAVYVAGLDDQYDNRHDLNQALAGLPAGALVILLAHEPDFATTAAADGRVALQLSGHSHGGQVRLPFLRATWLPRLGRRFPHGWYQVGAMQLYVNRGIGVVGVPVRFNCRPEVTHFTLRRGV